MDNIDNSYEGAGFLEGSERTFFLGSTKTRKNLRKWL